MFFKRDERVKKLKKENEALKHALAHLRALIRQQEIEVVQLRLEVNELEGIREDLIKRLHDRSANVENLVISKDNLNKKG
jgi:chromosome segregation ATPase